MRVLTPPQQRPFTEAINSGSLEALRSAIHDEDVRNARIFLTKESLLHYAVTYGTTEMVLYLYEHGIPLDLLDVGGWSALSAAVRRGLYDTARWMLEQGVPADCGNPAIPAVSNGDLEMVKLLADYGDDFQLVFGEPPRTLYDQAVNFGHPHVAEYLTSRGVKPLSETERTGPASGEQKTPDRSSSTTTSTGTAEP